MAGIPVLYSFRRCPYAIRARLALAVSGTTVALREVVLRSKPAALLSASPKATIPVLVRPDGSVLDESLNIMRWTLERSDPEGWLLADEAETGILIALCDGPFKQALDRCKYPERFSEADPVTSWSAAQVYLQTWEEQLRATHFLGSARSLADAAIFPFVRQFAAIEPERWTALPLPRLQAWLSAWLEGELFAGVMDKHVPWREGDAPIAAFGSSAADPQAGE